MAKKRMFSIDIITTDKFYDLGLEAQALYFQLSMQADDHGFIDKARSITRTIGATPDALQKLVKEGYLIEFENSVYCVTHFRINNNKIPKDRYTPTLYTDFYKKLIDEPNRPYRFCKQNVDGNLTDSIQENDKTEENVNEYVNKSATDCKKDVKKLYTQNRIDKKREEKSKKDKNRVLNNIHSSIYATTEKEKNSKELPELERNTLYNYWQDREQNINTVVVDLLKQGYNQEQVQQYKDYIELNFNKYKH